MYKQRLSKTGQKIAEAVKHDVAATKVEPKKDTNATCGSCYGAEDASQPCCNSCDEVWNCQRGKTDIAVADACMTCICPCIAGDKCITQTSSRADKQLGHLCILRLLYELCNPGVCAQDSLFFCLPAVEKLMLFDG